MSPIPVRFVYETGVRRDLSRKLWLRGNWANGRRSTSWTNTPMAEVAAPADGCPTYEAVVQFEADQIGTEFTWGIGAGPTWPDEWLIMTEVRDANRTDRVRTFTLAAQDNPDQVYRLSVARWLGAQKYAPSGGGPEQLRFAVWAPNAKKVEVVIGRLWLEQDPLTREPFNPPGGGTVSAPVEAIRGGYIADDGDGILPGGQNTIPMEGRPDGVWVSAPPAPLVFKEYDHRPYMYRVTRSDGSVVYRTDIHSRCQIGGGSDDPRGGHFAGATMLLDGGKSCSVVVDPDTVTREDMISAEPDRLWPEVLVGLDQFWGGLERPARKDGRTYPGRVEDLVIYELHLGALGFGHDRPGTLDDAIGLLDHLERLGVNAVELLPLSEFGGGAQNWGYATSHYYAIEYAGGGRDHFKLFVRECHRRGIAVIMDVVYNHFAHDADRAEWLYDTIDHGSNCYYWYEGRPGDYPGFDSQVEPGRRGTGGYVDNMSTAFAPRYHEEVVRKTLISSAVTLMEEFHIDGFRVDQTTSIHAYNALHADGRPVGSANAFGGKLLRELARTLRTIRPDIVLTAEDHSTWDAVTRPVGDGGLGFDARWYADFYHHLIGDTDKGTDYAKLLFVAGQGDDRPLAMGYFAGAMAASKFGTVVYHESHDEAGNGRLTHRTIYTAVNGAALVGDTRRYAEARCRFVAGMAMLSAGTPMFLFGEEVGSDRPFLYAHVLENREDLVAEAGGAGRNLFRFYQGLIRFRLSHAGLRTRNLEVLYTHDANRVIAFHRWSNDGDDLLVLGSLNNRPFSSGYVFTGLAIPDGRWREVFNSDAADHGGDNVGNLGAAIPAAGGRFEAVIPANGFVVFARE